MEDLPKSYDPKIVEEKWFSFWKKKGFFRANPHSSKPPYCIVIPPPNVTGVLHMGHALVDTLQDILIRWQRMCGKEVLWLPGTDHAGIATQTIVEKDLFQRFGKRRTDFSREEFLSYVWEWKDKSEQTILSQLEKLGCSCDWSRLAFTMDEERNRAVRTAFKKLFDKGLIYQGDYLVNWDPITQTALSDDEVEHEEREGFLYHIRYPLEDGTDSLIIATTRPETMLGDVAVAVHPEDLRYASLVGKQIVLPLSNRKIPLIADPFVDREFGTGAVKITPAHDFDDFACKERHNLPLINILSLDGRICLEDSPFFGLSVVEARRAIVDALEKQGFLVKKEPHRLRVGVSYRSKATLEPFLSKQWFVNMRSCKERLLQIVQTKEVRLLPPHWEDTYNHWIENVRDWCISRQLWWGHRIPIWKKGDQIVCFAGEGLPPEVEKDPEGWTQDPDVLDTWFSSALWPFSSLGWPEKTPELATFYPTSTLITGHDILFFWVARMILMGELLTDSVPFHESFLHGLIYGKSYWRVNPDGSSSYVTKKEKDAFDQSGKTPSDVHSKWEKMSKSKGNVLDPLELIDRYGTDAVRFALVASATQARQIDLDPRKFEEYKNFANKIWNGARFVLLHLEDLSTETLSQDLTDLRLEDEWILSILSERITALEKALSSYSFDVAAKTAYEFFWNEFCAIYVEATKSLLQHPSQRSVKQKVLLIVLTHAIALLHPILPFLTEEIFHTLRTRLPHLPSHHNNPWMEQTLQILSSPACIVAPYPRAVAPSNPHVVHTFSLLQNVVRSVRNLRAELQIPPKEKITIYLEGKSPFQEDEMALLSSLCNIDTILFGKGKGLGAKTWEDPFHIFLPIPPSLLAKEKERLEKEIPKLEEQVRKLEHKLENREFLEKAPSHILQEMKNQLQQATVALHSAKEKRSSL